MDFESSLKEKIIERNNRIIILENENKALKRDIRAIEKQSDTWRNFGYACMKGEEGPFRW